MLMGMQCRCVLASEPRRWVVGGRRARTYLVRTWVGRAWHERGRELRTRALGDPFGLADCGVAEAQRFAPGRAVCSQLGPHFAVDVELVKRLAECGTGN